MFNKNKYIKKERHELELENLRIVHRGLLLDQRVEFEEKLGEKNEEVADRENRIIFLQDQLSDERKNRDLLIQAEVQKQLGEYETKYYHDLHSNLEERADGMQKFQETFFDKLLGTLEKFKSPEAKVMILGKEVFGVDQKAGGGKGGGEKKND